MVKLGNNFSEKNSSKVVSEDGFDTIPLITPLDASQLQFPPPEKVRHLCFLAAVTLVHVRPTYMRNDPSWFGNVDNCVANCRTCVAIRWW